MCATGGGGLSAPGPVCSGEVLTAVDRQGGAVDVAGVVGNQEHDPGHLIKRKLSAGTSKNCACVFPSNQERTPVAAAEGLSVPPMSTGGIATHFVETLGPWLQLLVVLNLDEDHALHHSFPVA